MIVLAVILAVLLVLALLPVGMQLRYDGQTLWLHALLGPVRLQLLPGKSPRPKKQKRRRSRAVKKAPQEAKKTAPKRDLSALLGKIRPLLALVRDFLQAMRRRVTIRRLRIHIQYGADNPADAAIHYGQAWAGIGVLAPVLNSAFRIRKQDLQAIYCDETPGFSAEVELVATLLVCEIFGLGFRYGIRAVKAFLPEKSSQKPTKKAVQKHESSTSRPDASDPGQNP